MSVLIQQYNVVTLSVGPLLGIRLKHSTVFVVKAESRSKALQTTFIFIHLICQDFEQKSSYYYQYYYQAYSSSIVSIQVDCIFLVQFILPYDNMKLCIAGRSRPISRQVIGQNNYCSVISLNVGLIRLHLLGGSTCISFSLSPPY